MILGSERLLGDNSIKMFDGLEIGKRELAYELPGFVGFYLNNPVDWKFLEFLAQVHPEIFPTRNLNV